MRAMILAAGFGTRLRPLTEELPKPLVPVLGRPLIEYTIELLRASGITSIVINVHHHPEAIPEALGDGGRLGVELSYVVEDGAIRGTGGGIRGARRLLDDGGTFVVINGDILLEPDLGAALELHERLGGMATMILRPDPRAAAYGAVDVDSDGRVRRLLGRPELVDAPELESMMFSGVHVLEPEVFSRLPEEGCIVRTLYREMIDGGEVVGGFVDGGPWVELGTVGDYLRVNLALLGGELKMRSIKGPEGGLLVDASAEIADGVALDPPVCVGPRARVLAAATRAVIWPDAVVTAPVQDAVVTPRGVVRPGTDTQA